MTRICVFGFLLISQLLQLASAAKCPSSFLCGNVGNFEFPFTTAERPDCGELAVRGCNHPEATASKSIELRKGQSFEVIGFYWKTVVVRDNNLHENVRLESCKVFENNVILPRSSALASYSLKGNITMFRCNHTLNSSLLKPFYSYTNCSDYNIFYACRRGFHCKGVKYPSLAACSTIQLPTREPTDSRDPFTFLSSEIHITAQLSHNCSVCLNQERGQCKLDNRGIFYCCKAEDKAWIWKLSLGIGITAFVIIGLLIAWHYKRKFALSRDQFQRRNRDSYSNPDLEVRSVHFNVPIFSYRELQEATDNFDNNGKLGDGGYGTVYYAKLRDGREVAVKRLYDHNYRRVQQFMNEVEILTRLHHKNLVSLYGCTSRHSHELLLVYEYIPNGTVACHLHGHLSNLGLLSWPIRMKIAIETASALNYLHTSNIIHRDVKTNNILLENNYSVKVVDFGLSRLFPNNVTHVSTAPQGTLGYVDPEYHQCYQLTNKSDVYSFGVVLVELISSMLPVDMTRHKDEINLANLAIKKIRRGAIDELVDPSLGFHSNNDIKRTVTLVAEVAFQCLQLENQLRPSMDEVLAFLMRIDSGRDELKDMTQEFVKINGKTNLCYLNQLRDLDEVRLLKDAKFGPSPATVTENWESECTTPNISC